MCEIIFADAHKAADLAAAHAACFEKGWNEAAMRQLLLMPNAFGFLAVAADGCAGLIVCSAAADEAEIVTIGVVPSYRRRGVAKTLLEKAVLYAAMHGVRALFLEVAVDNAAACALYRQTGFREVGMRKNYYHTTHGLADAVVMKLDLTV